jgi:hypothetical protein
MPSGVLPPVTTIGWKSCSSTPEETSGVGKLSYGLRITELAAEDPDRVAVVCDSESLTREELERRANRLAREFLARGVEPGRLVTIGLPNGFPFIVACVATWKCGAIPNPLSPRLPAAECISIPYRGLFPSPPLFDRMPTYRTQGKRSLNFLSALRHLFLRRMNARTPSAEPTRRPVPGSGIVRNSAVPGVGA